MELLLRVCGGVKKWRLAMRKHYYVCTLLMLFVLCFTNNICPAQDISSGVFEEDAASGDTAFIYDGSDVFSGSEIPETLPVEDDGPDDNAPMLPGEDTAWEFTDDEIFAEEEDFPYEDLEMEEAVTEAYEEFEESEAEFIIEDTVESAETSGEENSGLRLLGDGGGSFQGISSSVYRNEIYGSSSYHYIYYIDFEMGEDGYYRNHKYHIVRFDMETGSSIVLDTVTGAESGIDFFYAGDKLYFLGKSYYSGGEENNCSVFCMDLLTGITSEVLHADLGKDGAGTVAADDRGNVYIGTTTGKRLLKYAGDGVLLAEGSDTAEIEDIIGIGQNNGCIYYQGPCTRIQYGYEEELSALKVAGISGDSVIFPGDGKYIVPFFVRWFYKHYGNAQLLGGRYLTGLATYDENTVFLFDTDKISVDQVTAGGTKIPLLEGGVSVNAVNLADMNAALLAAATKKSTYEDMEDTSGVGTRSAYFPSDNSLLVVTDDREIRKYDIAGKKYVGTIETSYPVYKLLTAGGSVVAVEEEDGNMYVETFFPENPAQVFIAGPSSLQAGDEAVYSCSFPGDLIQEYVFTSSNPSVLSVDADGNASAWKDGTAVVTVTADGGRLSASMEVTVSGHVGTVSAVYEINGTKTSNINAHEYDSYGNIVNSYLVEVDSGTLMRAEARSDSSLLIEYMGWDGKVRSSRTVAKELSFFGGFYAGKDAFYVVYGQANPGESDSVEVLRIVKYDRAWNRLGACSLYGENTYNPVDFGSLRMDEYQGVLYIHTCHVMYKSSDGLNHQANMTFEINESDMSLKNSSNALVSYGYVSHSFNQFIQEEGGIIYRVDHGDAYPRGITVSAYAASSGIVTEPYICNTMYEFENTDFGNYTGASVGGMEVTGTHVVVAFNEDSSHENGQRNIKIATCKKNGGSMCSYSVTSYGSGAGVYCRTPRLVKISDGKLLLMWSEFNTQKKTTAYRFAHLNGAGQVVDVIDAGNYAFSDCQPILLSDGTVAWYVSDGNRIVLFRINPYDLADIQALGRTLTPMASSSGSPDDGSIAIDWDSGLFKEKLGEDGTPFGRGASVITMEDALISREDDADPAGTVFGKLKLKSTSQGTHNIRLSWSKVKGASVYVVYGNKCGKKNKMKYLGYTRGLTFNVSSIQGKKIAKGKYYKFFVAAVDKNDYICTSSKYIHVVSKGGKGTNIRKLKPKKKKVKLKAGKSVKLKIKTVKQAGGKLKTHRKIAYEVSNSAVATVDAKGKIKAIGKGTCFVTAYAQNGVSVKIKVSVK